MGIIFLRHRDARGVFHILGNLLAEGAMHDGAQSAAKVGESNVVTLVAVAILRLEALQVAEVMIVDDADQAIKFLDVVLQRSGSKEQFMAIGKSGLQSRSHRRR